MPWMKIPIAIVAALASMLCWLAWFVAPQVLETEQPDQVDKALKVFIRGFAIIVGVFAAWLWCMMLVA